MQFYPAAETDNISSVMKKFHQALGDRAGAVFSSFGLDALTRGFIKE
jgi:hypothetical protein